MAVKNSAAVYINGINYTHYVVMPLKWGNFLDEQLDEMNLTLRRSKKRVFAPLTPVEIHLKNELYWGQTVDKTCEQVKQFIVANDSVTEVPVGKGLYDHELALIELTKIMECIVVDTCTFTNDIGRNYLNSQSDVYPEESSANWRFDISYPTGFKNPMRAGDSFTVPAPHSVFLDEPPDRLTPPQNLIRYTYSLTISQNGAEIFQESYVRQIGDTPTTSGSNEPHTFILQDGQTYSVLYECELYATVGSPSPAASTTTGSLLYTFYALTNEYPLKKWTITDVCGRLFDIAEPLRQGQKPRFYLQGIDPVTGNVTAGSQADKFDKILAPQFSMTKSTLRECLQQVGGVVHGEPRCTAVKASDGNWYYEVSFDEYGSTARSGIYARKYITDTASQVIDSYASTLDTNAENLVNQLDKYAGVIVEPYASGYKTVRTETLYTRISDENMLIQTQFPIYSIEKLECGIVPQNTSISAPIDITAYVFESTIYDSQLSSYESQYPYSKAYGLKYTQGEKNITALNFKQEHPVSDIFNEYAIINILRAASGNDSLDITGASTSGSSYTEGNYPQLAFRVTYTPFYNARVGQSKINYTDFPYGAGLIYNQQANVIESRYYGENLKGAIARTGNIEVSKTYNLSRLSQIPVAGVMYNDDYYISAVSVEFLPTYIKCTIGLSKDFNRLSKYIGISSTKRFSEVSQGQALERNTLWKEYIVVGDSITADTGGFTLDAMLEAVAATFTQSGEYKPLSAVYAFGTSYSGEGYASDAFGLVTLPVISSAFGNSISFAWSYEDNYSAGAISQYASAGSGKTEVTGYFQNNYQYTDYYGKVYYYQWTLFDKMKAPSNFNEQSDIGQALPNGNGTYTDDATPCLSTSFSSAGEGTVAGAPIVLRKDNREKLQCNVQLDFVTNRKGFIIGSALAAYCPAVRGVDSSLAAKLYVFQEPLNKFIDHAAAYGIDLSAATAYDVTVSSAANGQFSISAGNFAESGKAWAICTPQSNGETYTVEDEEGNTFEYTDVKGGDVLIAQNMDISAGDAFPTIYFTKKREVFNKSVWTDIR